ncbi:hypothetical protein ATKI12_0911 [Kitasatospora sp. Ki12]
MSRLTTPADNADGAVRVTGRPIGSLPGSIRGVAANPFE